MGFTHSLSVGWLSTVFLSITLPFSKTAFAASYAESEVANASSYDYIIVGGGLSGLVVANRLTEDPSKSVLVVEYGSIDNTTTTLWPYYVQGVQINGQDVFSDIVSVPQPGFDNQTFSLTVASVVGGGSIVNGMAFDRGTQADYDSWGELGNEGWDWDNLLTYFRKSATFTPGTPANVEKYNYTYDQAAYGHGPVQASLPPFQFPGMPTFWDSLEELNVTKVQEGALGKPGAFWEAASIDPVLQTRSSARTAYYDPIVNRTNLNLLTGHYVHELVLRNLTVEGVKIVSRADNSTTLAYAKKEVILAAGAVHTPQILQLNGIGPSTVLEAAGVDVIVDLPGVGTNFQDHPVAYLNFNLTTDPSFPNPTTLSTNVTYNETAYEEYITNRTGPYTQAHGNGAAFLPLQEIAPEQYSSIASALAAQDATAYLPSIYKDYPTLLAGFLAQRKIHIEQLLSPDTAIYEFSFQGGGTATTALQKPISRGTILLNPADPFGEPIVDFQGLINPTDREAFIAAVKYTRQIYNTTAVSAYGPVEVTPGAEYQTDAEIYSALAGGVAQPSFAHPACTCAMLPEDLGGVVSADLKVYGVKHLSIVDASIMPVIPATHLQATVYAIAEKAADIIKVRAQH